MKKLGSSVMLILALGSIVHAQIKVVGDDYSDSLSAAKNYYEQDVNFDVVFPAFSIQNRKSVMESHLKSSVFIYNLTGDTFYLCQTDHLNDFEFATDENGRGYCCMDMPIGYYVISGYVFCTDNENIIRESAGLSPFKYDSPKETIHNLKQTILLDDGDGDADVGKYIRYIVFKSIDTNGTYTYYRRTYYDHMVNFIQLRFYNEARKFIDKEVEVGVPKYDSIEHCSVIQDDLTGNLIKLKDKSFVFKDVVLKGNDLYIVLEGKETGSFGRSVEVMVYPYDKYDLRDRRYPFEGDIACFRIHGHDICAENRFYEREDFFVIKKDDINALYARAKIASAQHEKELKLIKQQLDQERKKKDEDFKQKMIAKYGTGKGTLVGKRQVAIGMTEGMVRDAWGRPMNTYRTTTKYGQSEVWCYNYKTRVYFYNGKVVQIDN